MQGYPPLVSPLCMLVCFNPHSSSRLNAKEPEIKRATLPFRRRERDSNPRGFHPTVFKTVAIDHLAIPPTRLYHIHNPFEKSMAEKSHVMVKMETLKWIITCQYHVSTFQASMTQWSGISAIQGPCSECARNSSVGSGSSSAATTRPA